MISTLKPPTFTSWGYPVPHILKQPRHPSPVSHHHLLSWPSPVSNISWGYPLPRTSLCHIRKPPTSIKSLLTRVSAPTGSRSCYRPQCKTCPIHHPINAFTSCTKLTNHADCKSMNLIYQLHCTKCIAFYIGETYHSLSDRINPTKFLLRTASPVIHKLPDSTPDHIRHQFETAYQLVLQSCYTPWLNIC